MQARASISAPDAPRAIGPYSQAIRAGQWLFLSGQIPLDPVSGEVVEGDVRHQTRRVLENMSAVLAAAGVSFDAVVKTTVFLTDLADFTAMNEVYMRHVNAAAPPARSTVAVAALPRGARVEIDCVATVKG
jgi:2-iminobutanoate/2-iminopropanoate deaminase